jgi:hypothetical protein
MHNKLHKTGFLCIIVGKYGIFPLFIHFSLLMRLILLKKQNKRDTDRIKICKFAKTRGAKLPNAPRKTRVNTLKIMNNEKTSSAGPRVIEKDNVTVRFSGDSGDGMQLAGNIFSTVSAISGNDICTFPNYPADIRAPQGTRSGVSAFQVHIGSGKVYTPGDSCDILVAMNAAALATQYMFCKPTAAIIIDSDCFKEADLKKANYKTLDPVEELGIKNEIVQVPITSMVKDCLKDSCGHKISDITTGYVKYVGVSFNLPVKPKDILTSKSGRFPDPIITGQSCSVPANETQCLWVTVKVPEDAEAGIYRGLIKVTGTIGSAHFNVYKEITLKVYPVVMKKPTFGSANY